MIAALDTKKKCYDLYVCEEGIFSEGGEAYMVIRSGRRQGLLSFFDILSLAGLLPGAM